MIKPYSDDELGKKSQVASMFNSIAHRYDFLNHFFSLGIDKIWRKKTIDAIKELKPKTILDIATGTGDLAIEAVRLNPEKIIGVDISVEMLEIGKKKIEINGLSNIIKIEIGDSEKLNFPDESFDAVMVAFGVRNFENLELGLSEIFRVTRKGGKVAILEFTTPEVFPVKQLYKLYFKRILPFIGKKVSKDSSAYSYLPDSVEAFPKNTEFIKILDQLGFKDTYQRKLSMGIASIYVGAK